MQNVNEHIYDTKRSKMCYMNLNLVFIPINDRIFKIQNSRLVSYRIYKLPPAIDGKPWHKDLNMNNNWKKLLIIQWTIIACRENANLYRSDCILTNLHEFVSQIYWIVTNSRSISSWWEWEVKSGMAWYCPDSMKMADGGLEFQVSQGREKKVRNMFFFLSFLSRKLSKGDAKNQRRSLRKNCTSFGYIVLFEEGAVHEYYRRLWCFWDRDTVYWFVTESSKNIHCTLASVAGIFLCFVLGYMRTVVNK